MTKTQIDVKALLLRSDDRQFLVELVNLADESVDAFNKKWGYQDAPSAALRNVLQRLWSGDEKEANETVWMLLLSPVLAKKTEQLPVYPNVAIGKLRPRPDGGIYARLAIAILENYAYLRRCANPDCQRYFIAKRTTQHYCDRLECGDYARKKRMRDYYHATKGDTK